MLVIFLLEEELPEKITEKVSEISYNIEGINDRSRDYIRDIVILINKEIGINKILSIILFGSQQHKKENTAVSDCDLLLIFKDRVSNHHIREIEKYFIALEIKHKFAEPNTNIVHYILGVLQKSTGMFISHFLTKRKYWENANFPKIFQVNKVFSGIFAPRNIVLGNVVLNSTILYGEDLRHKLKPKIKITIFEIFRSMVMNLFISFFSLFIAPFKNLNPVKYQLEAIKWSLKSSNYFGFRDSVSLIKITDRIISMERKRKRKKARNYYEKFLSLRRVPTKKDLYFMIRSPIRILKIHGKAITYRRLLENRSTLIKAKPESEVSSFRTFPVRL